MFRKTVTSAGLAALAALGPAGAQPVPLAGGGGLPRPGVVMLWASWCVPCRAEIGRVPRLAAAARPLPFIVLALDPPEVARSALAGRDVGAPVFADGRPPAVVLAEWGGAGAAMPLAVAIDRDGRPCGLKRGLLGTDQLHAWAKSCSR